MTVEQGIATLRRFLVGVTGIAAVPFILAGVVGGVFGYLLWPIVVIVSTIEYGGFDYDQRRSAGWLLLGYLAYTVASGVAAFFIVRRTVDASDTTANGIAFILSWGLLLMAAAASVAWMSGWF